MKQLDVAAAALVIVGALNWGLVGTLHFDLVATIFGMKFGDQRLVLGGLSPGGRLGPISGAHLEIDPATLAWRDR